MPGGIAERHPAQADLSRPDRAKRPQQGLEEIRRPQPIARYPPVIIETAGPRRPAEMHRVGGADLAASAQEQSTAFEPDERILRAVLKGAGEPSRREARQYLGVGAPWVARIRREQSGLHRPQACYGEPFG